MRGVASFALLHLSFFCISGASNSLRVMIVRADPLLPYGGAWQARLDIRVAPRPFAAGSRSVLVDSVHSGPLRLQKPLWPEGPHPLHLLLLHPPGGLAAGDQLTMTARVAQGASVLLTTPGAGKFYRADSPSSFQVSVDVEAGAELEWLPQETIVQNGANAVSSAEFRLSAGSRALGSDLLVLGRRDSGESFTRGEFLQKLSIYRDDRLMLQDLNLWRPDLLPREVSMKDHHVCAMLWAARPSPWHEDELAVLESALDEIGPLCGVSQVTPGLLLLRVLGSQVEPVRRLLHQAWAHLRPQIFDRQASLPRIWNT